MGAARERDLLQSRVDDGRQTGKYVDMYVLDRAVIVDYGKHGGNAGGLECGVEGREVDDFHTRQTQNSNVVMVNS